MMPLQFQAFSPVPQAAEKLPPFRFEALFQRVLSRAAHTPFKPTGLNQAIYLDLAEQIIRAGAKWQNQDGAIIDPVTREEWGQSSPRFVSSAAVLLSHGRIPDLREQVFQGMDWCCRRLTTGAAKSPDFWTRELMTAWFALDKVQVPPERRARWETDLRNLDCEKVYWQVEKPDKPIETLHNWTIYAAAGEGLRQLADLGPQDQTFLWGAAYWDKYMPYQLAHISEDGMYRDPGDPFTYDMTTRLQIATPLAFGLETTLRPIYEELLRRGALTQLLYVSPEGFAPFGGRSNAMQFQEAILAAIGEMEARRYRDANPQLAGAFKRQAHLGVRSIRRWFEMQPLRHLKNGFPPDQLHGCEDYALYSVYSLFCASCLVLAAEFADDTIPESATPAEAGGYLLELEPAFHKIFATCAGSQLEIDTRSDLHYDATGLGRFLVAGAPYELALASPICAHPGYRIPKELRPPVPISIGPAWLRGEEWISLASLSEGLKSQLAIERESPEELRFTVTWLHAATASKVTEHYTLRAGRLTLAVSASVNNQPVPAIRLTLPALVTDGSSTSTSRSAPDHHRIDYNGSQLAIHYARTANVNTGDKVANRQGIYHPLHLEWSGSEAQVELTVTPI